MANTARVLIDDGRGGLDGQPVGDFGTVLLTQSQIRVRPGGLLQSTAAHFEDLAGALDAARSVPGIWTFPGNGGSLATNQTVFPIPGGYTSGFVKVRIGPFPINSFTATDGTTVVIAGYTFGATDVVTIEVLKAGFVANAATKADLDAKLDATAQALALVLDGLPSWDPATPYPTTPGLYRQGDANGYTLLRIYPRS